MKENIQTKERGKTAEVEEARWKQGNLKGENSKLTNCTERWIEGERDKGVMKLGRLWWVDMGD